MNSVTHPDTEQLNAYVQNPRADDYRQIRLHLAGCVDCRQQVSLLSTLKMTLHEFDAEQYRQAVSGNDELHQVLQQQEIEKLIEGELNQADQLRVSRMLREEPQAMKAALHYASHSARMQREMEGDGGSMVMSDPKRHSDYARQTRTGMLTVLRQWMEIRTPVWLTVPATAIMASLLSLVLIPLADLDRGKYDIIAYQDNPVIQFKSAQALPGIGFFSAANTTSKPYGEIKANLSNENTIRLLWPTVDDAVSYTMQLKLFADGKQTSVGSVTTASTLAMFKRADRDAGHRYIWKLSGKTSTGKLFSAKGGFVINSVFD